MAAGIYKITNPLEGKGSNMTRYHFKNCKNSK
jgi:hypothetical protein